MQSRSKSRRGLLQKAIISIGLGLLVVLAAQPARAQGGEQVKPYVMLLFDTSGSMIWDLCHHDSSAYANIDGDNSNECPGDQISCSFCNAFGCGNGLLDDARLYKVKQGMFNVVSAFGEVTFALSRFAQEPASFTCDASSYGRAGGWSGIGCSGNPSMGTGGNQADVLVGFADDNQLQIQRWMNNCDDYPSVGACPLGVDPGGSTPSSGCNLCGDCGGGCDYELRGSGSTPISGSLYDLRVNFFPSVIQNDSLKDCRPYRVILLTDGQNNCPGDPAQQAGLLYNLSTKSIPVHVVGFGSSSLKPDLDDIASSGGTGEAVVVDNEVALALAMANIVSESLLRELCNGADDDCDTLCDEAWPEVAAGSGCSDQRDAQSCTVGVGICERTGIWVCKADGSGSQCSVTPGPPDPGGEICGNGLDDNCNGIVDEGCEPWCNQPDICNGEDDNCNGLVDEDYQPIPCGVDIGECEAGMTACVEGEVICSGSVPPSTELCNAKDDNCDTVIDSFTQPCYPPGNGVGCNLDTGECLGICQIGTQLCTMGSWGACWGFQGPIPEVCNGLDDDCDGVIDDGVGNTCTDYTDCSTYITCTACPPPPPEDCDCVDNDCNGLVDDNVLGEGDPCGGMVGECTPGTKTCDPTACDWICEEGTEPTEEICDGKDNDCDNETDEDLTRPCQSPCGDGIETCENGVWSDCNAPQPQPEVCNGKDDDCDLEIDEDAECPPGFCCVDGRCVEECKEDEFPCPPGYTCIATGADPPCDEVCWPNVCTGVECPPGQKCDPQTGDCVDNCQDVECPPYQKCDPETGNCVDDSCKTKGCPEGQKCVNYECMDDPCPPGKCPAGQMCLDGTCSDTCANVECPSGQTCSQGKCIEDPCEGFKCESLFIPVVAEDENGNKICKCESDPCSKISCPSGQRCNPETQECEIDPCETATCPEGFRCFINHRGEADCELLEEGVPTTTQVLASGTGGCSCRTSPSEPPTGTLLLMIVLGLMLLSRRKRNPH